MGYFLTYCNFAKFSLNQETHFRKQVLKFIPSKKAKKIDKTFTDDLKLSVKSTVKISSIFVAFLDYTNFTNGWHVIFHEWTMK